MHFRTTLCCRWAVAALAALLLFVLTARPVAAQGRDPFAPENERKEPAAAAPKRRDAGPLKAQPGGADKANGALPKELVLPPLLGGDKFEERISFRASVEPRDARRGQTVTLTIKA